ncbi:lipopolysaccharide biosynthesis protein [Microbacterium testaceum]|uniref:lipopolysaccharide biosynthesis protein n=1 Tax=Microbacterium testaceum TaxID=2033 RepID=UPI0022E15EB8|nr:lipopolysaccharide biosynthesis protein [Microbacterium testaceum]
MSLSAAAARGGAVTLMGQFAKIAIQLVGLVVLSRLLSPADFGLIAMVTVIVSLADLVRDFGLSTAAIQAPSLNSQQRSNLFWLNTIIGVVLSIALVASAPIIGSIYGDARLLQISYFLALVFVLNGLQTQFQVSLVRSFRFKEITIIEVVAQVVGLSAAIVSALMGAEYMALVFQILCTATVLLLLKAIASGWLPGRYNKATKIDSFVRYGGHLLGTQALVYLSTNIDTFLIGRIFGANAVGQYTRAFQVLNLPMNQLLSPISNVALPTLSRVADDFARASRYLRVLHSVTTVAFASLLGIAVGSAQPLFSIAFGRGWDQAAELFQIVAVAGFFQAASFTTYWVFTSRALTRVQLKSAIVGRSIMIISIIAAAFVSVEMVALAFGIGCAISWVTSLLWCRRVTVVPFGALVAATLSSFVFMCLIAGAGIFSMSFLAEEHEVLKLIVALTSSCAVIAVLFLLPSMRAAFQSARKIVSATLGKGT